MPLIPYAPFTSGTVFTPEIANEIARPVFDGLTQYFGHNPKILDSDLDDGASSLKNRVGALGLNLRVSAGSGLNANHASGRLLYGTTLYTLGASSVSLAPSAVNYVYGSLGGAVIASTTLPPVIRALLATVTTNTTSVIAVADYREGVSVEVVKPFASSLRNFGGRGDQGSFVATNNEVLSDGEYYFSSFNVPSGVTLIIDKLVKIYCTGSAVILGAITVTQAATGGSASIFGGSLALTPGSTGQGFGSAAGENPSSPYSHHVSPVGSGGCSGGMVLAGNNIAATTKAGGNGGGCFWIEAAGSINVSGTIVANGTAGTAGAVSGDSTNGTATSAGSGGSGGLILFKSLESVVVNGTLSVAGGAGGSGAALSGLNAESGCGGGGGRVVVLSPSINTTGSTLNLAGGSAGTGGLADLSGVRNSTNTNGGSYGGMGGSASASTGQPGGSGVLVFKSFAPIG